MSTFLGLEFFMKKFVSYFMENILILIFIRSERKF